MKKKIIIGVAILLAGFLLGGVTFYLLGKMTGQQRLSAVFRNAECPAPDFRNKPGLF